MGAIHGLGVLFLFTATFLLLVVSVSAPIWRSVYFLSADLSASVGELVKDDVAREVLKVL